MSEISGMRALHMWIAILHGGYSCGGNTTWFVSWDSQRDVLVALTAGHGRRAGCVICQLNPAQQEHTVNGA